MHSLCSYESINLYKISHSYYIYIFKFHQSFAPYYAFCQWSQVHIYSTYSILPTSVSSLVLHWFYLPQTRQPALTISLCHPAALHAILGDCWPSALAPISGCGLRRSFSDLVSRALRMLYITMPQSCAGRGIIATISCDRWHRRCPGPSQSLAEGWSKKKIL
jgi:hypothetical protein